MVMRVTGWSLNNNNNNHDDDDDDDLNDGKDSRRVFARSRCKHAVSVRAGRVYVLGGKDANVPLNDFCNYDIRMWNKQVKLGYIIVRSALTGIGETVLPDVLLQR